MCKKKILFFLILCSIFSYFASDKKNKKNYSKDVKENKKKFRNNRKYSGVGQWRKLLPEEKDYTEYTEEQSLEQNYLEKENEKSNFDVGSNNESRQLIEIICDGDPEEFPTLLKELLNVKEEKNKELLNAKEEKNEELLNLKEEKIEQSILFIQKRISGLGKYFNFF